MPIADVGDAREVERSMRAVLDSDNDEDRCGPYAACLSKYWIFKTSTGESHCRMR